MSLIRSTSLPCVVRGVDIQDYSSSVYTRKSIVEGFVVDSCLYVSLSFLVGLLLLSVSFKMQTYNWSIVGSLSFPNGIYI